VSDSVAQGQIPGYVTEFCIFDGEPSAAELEAMAAGSQDLS
jgi:hypothetical protein